MQLFFDYMLHNPGKIMAVRVYLNNSNETKEAIEWIEQRGIKYKILRGNKAVDPDTRVRAPNMWRSSHHSYFGIESYTETEKDEFYPRIRNSILYENGPNTEHNKDYSVGFVLFDEKEAIEFKLIYG